MIKEFKSLLLHDQEIDRLNIDFLLKNIKIHINVFNDEAKNYEKIEIVYEKVIDFYISTAKVETLEAWEIYSADIIEGEGFFIMNFNLLIGVGKPSIEISFKFVNLKINIL